MNINGAIRLSRNNVLAMAQMPDGTAQSLSSALGTPSHVGDVEGVHPLQEKARFFTWIVEQGAGKNYRRLGRRLAQANKHLYRNGTHGHGLILVLPDGTWRLIAKAPQFAPVIVDSLPMRVMKDGKVTRELPTSAHLNGLLRSELFLREFRPVDHISRACLYNDEFCMVRPGYHDDGEGKRLLYTGPSPQLADSIETIERFLQVMSFASPADKANTVGAVRTAPA